MTHLRNIDEMKQTARLIGGKWTLVVVWAALRGMSRFEEFHIQLGIARSILSSRLQRLIDHGMLERHPVSAGSRRLRYVCTERAEALRPMIQSLIVISKRH